MLFSIEIIEACNSTTRYLDDRLNIDNSYFDDLVNQINPSDLQLLKQMCLIHRIRIYI